MRSQIACERCRRSKVKCNNNGIYSICQACGATGRECRYSESSTGGGRRESVVARQPAPHERVNSQDNAPRKRQKRAIAPIAHNTALNNRDSPSTIEALDPSVLTPKVWKELYVIYQRHFASDIPFVHGHTFRTLVNQSAEQAQSSTSRGYSPLFLLAFLALTSRFHDDLVQHYCPSSPARQGDPLYVAEFYASEARKQMDVATSTSHGHGDSHTMLERAQAGLMLCLHEWGMLQGMKARLSLSTAIYTADLAGLHSKLNLDEMKLKRTQALDPNIEFPQITQSGIQRRTRPPPEYGLTDSEIHHRTFWSCFIMDRYLAGGYGRSKQIHVDKSCVPLPVSDHAFNFGVRTTTLPLVPRPSLGSNPLKEGGAAVEYGWHKSGRLSPTANGINLHEVRDSLVKSRGEVPETLEAGQNEGALSCFVRAIDLYSDVIAWSCAGGRRTEGTKSPWNPETEFARLNDALDNFTAGLPESLRLSDSNTTGYSDAKSPTHYILMHIVLLLCSIMLHREYVPFLPYICPKPEGPLDEPLIKEKPPNPSFWDNSARKCFKAARDLIDLLCKYKEWGTLVETPLTAFAVFQVCITGMWCQHFPQMDPDNDMRAKRATDNQHPANAYSILRGMCTRLKMARDWCTTVRKTNKHLHQRTKEYNQYKQANQAAESKSASSDSPAPAYRNGQGGLDEYILLEKLFKEFGIPYDEDREVDNEIPDFDSDADKVDCGSDSSKGAGHEDARKSLPAPPTGFNPINANAAVKAESPSRIQASTNVHDNHGTAMHNHATPPNAATPGGGYTHYHETPSHVPQQHQVHQYPAAALSADRQSLQMHHQVAQSPGMVSMYPHQQHPGPEQQMAYQQYISSFYTGPSWGTVEVAPFVEGQPSRNCNFDENANWLGELNKA